MIEIVKIFGFIVRLARAPNPDGEEDDDDDDNLLREWIMRALIAVVQEQKTRLERKLNSICELRSNYLAVSARFFFHAGSFRARCELRKEN